MQPPGTSAVAPRSPVGSVSPTVRQLALASGRSVLVADEVLVVVVQKGGRRAPEKSILVAV